jgi:hypothetical protein
MIPAYLWPFNPGLTGGVEPLNSAFWYQILPHHFSQLVQIPFINVQFPDQTPNKRLRRRRVPIALPRHVGDLHVQLFGKIEEVSHLAGGGRSYDCTETVGRRHGGDRMTATLLRVPHLPVLRTGEALLISWIGNGTTVEMRIGIAPPRWAAAKRHAISA